MSKQVRAALARALLAHTLDVLAACPVTPCIVSRDVTALDLARRRGVATLVETESGLNAALTLAREWALARGARAVLVVPADLPLLTSADVAAVLDLRCGSRSVVIVPDARGDGTNMLLLHPPDALSFAFGPQSFHEHCAQAETSQLALCVHRSPALALDLDTPADWKQISALDVCHLMG